MIDKANNKWWALDNKWNFGQNTLDLMTKPVVIFPGLKCIIEIGMLRTLVRLTVGIGLRGEIYQSEEGKEESFENTFYHSWGNKSIT